MRKDIYGQRKSVRVLPNQHVTLVYFIYKKEHGTANMSKMNVGYKNRLFSKIPTLVASGNAYIPLVDVISYIYILIQLKLQKS